MNGKKSVCASCSKEMESWSLSPVFVCAECDAELCLSCFVRKAEPGEHLKSHAYRIRSARPELVADGWAACDDLAMLDAIERLGLGNWTDVARAVGRGHSAEDVETHYFDLYASRPGSHLPPRVKLRNGKWTETYEDDAPRSMEEEEEEDAPKRREKKARYVRERLEETMNEQELIAYQVSLPGSELLGYMPLRGDFDVEHDNDAELMIADMEFLNDDDPADRDLKHQVLRAYNARLARRERRKRYVVERNLLDRKNRLDLQRAMTPQQKRMQLKLKGFAPFHSTQAHQQLVDGLVETDRLADRMAQLRGRIETLAATHNDNAKTHEHINNSASPDLPSKKKHKPPAAVPAHAQPAVLAARQQHALQHTPPVTAAMITMQDDQFLLSDLEMKLCDALQLPPRKYLEVKETLSVSNAFVLHRIILKPQTSIFNSRGTAAAHVGSRAQIDFDKAAKLYDFARAAGWIKARRRPAVATAAAAAAAPVSKKFNGANNNRHVAHSPSS